MTREEQIDWLCRLKADLNNGVIFTPWNKEFTEALTGILEQKSEWIPVSERLPEDAQTVLVTRACRRNRRRRNFVEEGEIIGGTWISPNDEYRIEVDSYTVIAWMPLPEPYKAESEDKE